MFFSQIEDGNAIAIYHGSVTHWAVCIGKSEDDEIIVLHRMPGEKASYTSLGLIEYIKQIFYSNGKIKQDKLTDIIDESTLHQLEIFKCRSDVNGNLCRAVAIHKAHLAQRTPGYNVFYDNCENFVYDCCSSYGLTTSFQVAELGYLILSAAISVGWFLMCSLYFRLGFLKSLCPSLLNFLILQCEFCQERVYTNVFIRNQRRLHAAVTRFVQGNDGKLSDIYQKSADVLEKTMASELKLDQGIKEDEITVLENGILEDIYHLCQPLNHSLHGSKDERAHSVGKLIGVYLALKISHVILLLHDVLENAVSSRTFHNIFHFIADLLGDFKAFSIAIDENQQAEESSQLKPRATEIIFILVGLFNPQKQDRVDLWKQANLYYAKTVCEKIGYLNIAFPFSGDDSVREKIFKYLDRYWDCLFDMNFSPDNVPNALALLMDAVNQFTEGECQDNDVKGLLGVTSQFISDCDA